MGKIRFGQYEARKLAAAYEAHHQAQLNVRKGGHDRPYEAQNLVDHAREVINVLREEYGLEPDPC